MLLAWNSPTGASRGADGDCPRFRGVPGSEDGEQFSGLKQSLVNRILVWIYTGLGRLTSGFRQENWGIDAEAEEMLQDQPWRQPEELVHGRFLSAAIDCGLFTFIGCCWF